MRALAALVELLGARRIVASQRRRIAHQADRIRGYRRELAEATAEVLLLREAVDRLREQAALTPDALPTQADRDLHACHQIWAATTAPTDTTGETR